MKKKHELKWPPIRSVVCSSNACVVLQPSASRASMWSSLTTWYVHVYPVYFTQISLPYRADKYLPKWPNQQHDILLHSMINRERDVLPTAPWSVDITGYWSVSLLFWVIIIMIGEYEMVISQLLWCWLVKNGTMNYVKNKWCVQWIKTLN